MYARVDVYEGSLLMGSNIAKYTGRAAYLFKAIKSNSIFHNLKLMVVTHLWGKQIKGSTCLS